MAPLPPVSNCIKASLHFTVAGDPNIVCVTHWGTSIPNNIPPADITAFAAKIGALGTSFFPSVMSPQVTWAGCTVQDITTNTGAVATQANTNVGTLAVGPVTAATSVLINHTTAYHYRGGHPRNYLPWGNGSVLTSPSAWTTAFQTSCQAAWSNLKSGFIGYAGPSGTSITGQVAISYFSGATWHLKPNGAYQRVPTLRNPPLTMPIISSVASLTPSTQRRRLRPG